MVAPGTYVSPRAHVHESALLGDGVRIYGDTEIGPRCIVEDHCIIGKPDMYALDKLMADTAAPTIARYEHAVARRTTVGPRCILGAATHIYEGSRLGPEVATEEFVRIGWDATIGARTRIMYRGQVYVGVTVGTDCRIAGYLADNSVIEDRVAFFGRTSHDYPYRTTTFEYRPSPRIRSDAIVAFGAELIGGVTIGERSYVGANAIITRDVPSDWIAVGANRKLPKADWPGKLGRFDQSIESPGLPDDQRA
jgi:acetyltransferase-like isoleucine patch superfamily enzyme